MLIYLNIPAWAPHLQVFQIHIVIVDHKWWNVIILWKENFSVLWGEMHIVLNLSM